MVKEMNAEQAFTGEASSSHQQKRQRRLTSTVEQEKVGEIGGGTKSETEARSGTMFDLDLLDCPVCCHALTNPIFQCGNGHIACSSCCLKLRSKCPACALPIGNYRCRIMERVVEAIIVPCPNAKHGCTEKFSYGKEIAHEKECGFALCYCPTPNCKYTGVYKDLYSHYYANHKDKDLWNCFMCGRSSGAWLSTSEKILILQESSDGPLVVLQCFNEPQGMYVTVNCIAHSAPGVGRFSYHLSYSFGDATMTFGSTEMNRIQKVAFQTPQEDFMSIPSYLNPQAIVQNLRICIHRLEEEEEEEEETVDDLLILIRLLVEEEEAVEADDVNNVRRSTREKKANSKYQNKVK
ncbi:PREDICTED: LOW QUALITY PROTEIN: E3 ubiquitin-protein ligase SINA-like 2 [Brassica oleracea var. oleracea]|uniref:LOW QUALITY PROTEIN: E3 ubiquitin-protein ligase SINA-like 2 n=1 Tax=Brassica oleracea var. oleracea TaxID=109376 RepID=UPI0006A6F34D|nr:PREDICTED: LOW QUALITY PROTEIN: E3 ubiquitin-protein ligase SINA-like 2 [Brassica oleracea var. oleracea]